MRKYYITIDDEKLIKKIEELKSRGRTYNDIFETAILEYDNKFFLEKAVAQILINTNSIITQNVIAQYLKGKPSEGYAEIMCYGKKIPQYFNITNDEKAYLDFKKQIIEGSTKEFIVAEEDKENERNY